MKRKRCLTLVRVVLAKQPGCKLTSKQLRKRVAELACAKGSEKEQAFRRIFDEALARDRDSVSPLLLSEGKHVALRQGLEKINAGSEALAPVPDAQPGSSIPARKSARQHTKQTASQPEALVKKRAAPDTDKASSSVDPADDSREVAAAAAALVQASAGGKRKRTNAAASNTGTTSQQDQPASPSTTAKKRRGAPKSQADGAEQTVSPTSPGKRGQKKQSPKMPSITETQGDEKRLWREDRRRTDVKHGRFSEEEKETIRQAAQSFAEQHDLPTDDWSWLYSTRTGADPTKTKGAWQSIAAALPHRKYKAVYSAGTRMLHEANYQGKWEAHEEEQLLQLVADKGRKWKDIGAVMNRLPESCRDKHKEISLGAAKKKGRWDKDETDKLRDIVQAYIAQHVDGEEHAEEATLSLGDLSSAAAAEASGRAVLDDVDWGAVSKSLGTRSPLQCMDKWYDQLAPSMTSTGNWASGDDRRMLKALVRSGPPDQEWMAEWDKLVPGRTSKITQRRWRMMCKCLPSYWNRPFADAVHHVAAMLAPGVQHHAETAQ